VLIASHGGLNLHIGNNDTADGTYQRVPGIRPDIRGQRLDAKKVDFTARALTWMREHPGRALSLFVRKLALTINRADIALNYSYAYYRDIPPLTFLIVGPWLLFPLAAGSAWKRELRPLTAFLVLYAISIAIFFISSRYRLPMLVPAALLAGATLDDLLRRRNIVRHLIAAVLIAIPVYWNFHLEDGRETEAEGLVFYRIEQGDFPGAQTLLDQIDDTHPDPSMLYYRTALALRDAKRTAEATALFERARTAASLHPETPLAASTALAEAYVSQGRVAEALSLAQSMDPSHFDATHAAALGRIAMNARDPHTAQSYFTRAATLDPRNVALHHDLGIAAFLTDDRATARRAFETAIRFDPRHASSLVNLAVIEAEAGEVEAARAHARRALEAKPGYAQALGLLEALE
jgi:thioredoxin-like negative regulator of GroEL